MLYLIAAIIGSSSLVILLKMFELKGVNMYVGITVNYIVGALLAFAFAPVRLPMGEVMASVWLGISILIGAMFMLSFVIYAVSAQRSGVAVTTISGRAAVVIPVLFAFTVMGEQATAVKVAMLVLILLSMFLILKKKTVPGQATEGKDKVLSGGVQWLILLPVAVFLFNGVNDTLVQYAQRTRIPSQDLVPMFTGVMFVGGALTGVVCYLISLAYKKHVPSWRDLLWGSILGFMNWICMIGVFYGLGTIEGSVFYPLYYVGAIVIATIAGVWVFKEKLSALNYLGIVIAVAAIAVLSMQ